MCASLSLCVVCCVLLRRSWRRIPTQVSFKRAETEQLYQVKRMFGGIGNMLFSICSQTENVCDPTVSLVNLELFLVSRTGGDPPCVDSKTPPCVHYKRTRVCAWCRNTRGRFECTHGGVLNPHTGFSKFVQRAATHTPNTHHDHNDTPSTTQHHTQHHTETDGERQK